ncbi:hypothetical protein [Pontibacter ramchanderi]|uniref:Uncharacterized protein n=1 Tax=Pontibacter ramchanderi TaxID=1179743 RepID=A0A2N3V2N8_9BACT|nr:hypothetical protein [Pontibacter ramchanderi]PKV75892.1 hypothetical protein BD749_0840 [Pontibacter ramchanderi]
MKGKELNVRFIAEKVYVTDRKPLALKHTNLQVSGKSFKSPAYWAVRVLAHIPEEKRLHVEVLSYNVGPCDFSSQQLSYSSVLEEIERLTFRSIDTNGLLNTLNGTRSVSISSKSMLGSSYRRGDLDYRTESNTTFKRIIKENFFVPIKNLRFKQGGVLFEGKLKGIKKKHEFEIRNNEIIEEFDAIKNYFANVLKTKKVEVFVTAEVLYDAVTPIEVTSPEIGKIDRNVIEDVKLETVKATIKWNPSASDNSTLFTMDEFFEAFGEENFQPSVFYKKDKDLLEDLVKVTESKHYKHLSYLSRKHDSGSMRLRFSHKPLSFIFLIRGMKHDHFVWETLDTEEATYIWHFPKSKLLRSAFDEVEGAIKIIKASGKTSFLGLNNELFTRINHNYKEGVDGFVEWKNKLEDILI